MFSLQKVTIFVTMNYFKKINTVEQLKLLAVANLCQSLDGGLNTMMYLNASNPSITKKQRMDLKKLILKATTTYPIIK